MAVLPVTLNEMLRPWYAAGVLHLWPDPEAPDLDPEIAALRARLDALDQARQERRRDFRSARMRCHSSALGTRIAMAHGHQFGRGARGHITWWDGQMRGRQDPGTAGNFTGLIHLRLGPPDPAAEVDEDAPPELSVNGSDTVRLRVLGEKGEPQIERWLKLVSSARLALMDSTYSAERLAAHVGERFFVMVADPDRAAARRATQAMLGMVKLDIAELERAFRG